MLILSSIKKDFDQYHLPFFTCSALAVVYEFCAEAFREGEV